MQKIMKILKRLGSRPDQIYMIFVHYKNFNETLFVLQGVWSFSCPSFDYLPIRLCKNVLHSKLH